MLIRERMTPKPICGRPDMPVTEAQALMRKHHIRHLPIVDDADKLVGLVTQRSLLSALPSDVSNFSRFEIGYVLSRIKVHHVMVKELVTIGEDTAMEEAARVMADKKIGCLPVMRDGELVGIITDNDLFATMVDLLGARRGGVRTTVLLPDKPGQIARLTASIAQAGGNLTVVVAYPTADPDTYALLFRVDNLPQERVRAILDQLEGIEIQDMRVI